MWQFVIVGNMGFFILCCILFQEPKEAITHYTQCVEEAPAEKKGECLKKLALAYYEDQSQDLAFKTYLKALEHAPIQHQKMSEKEKKHYDEALSLYLSYEGKVNQEIASLIRQKFSHVIEMHPEYCALCFFVAAAHANLDNMEEFFDLFYRAYCAYPEHYLAYKTLAVLNIKCYERCPVGIEKEKYREQILTNLSMAQKSFPEDATLYKLMVLFSPETEREKIVVSCLNKIINANIMVPRGEIAFYVSQADNFNLDQLSSQFIEKAKEWYPYSRAIDNLRKNNG